MWILSRNDYESAYAMGIFDESEKGFQAFKKLFPVEQYHIRVVSWADTLIELITTTVASGVKYENSYTLEHFPINEMRYK